MVYSYFVPNSSSKFLAQDAEMPRLSEMGWAGGRGLGWDGGEQSKGVVNTDFAIRYTVPNSPSAKMPFSISFSQTPSFLRTKVLCSPTPGIGILVPCLFFS